MTDFINESDLAQLTAGVWSSLLNLDVEPMPGTTVPDSESSLAACVNIYGAWSGSVALFCSVAAARQAASVLFAVEPSTATIEQMQDAVGELTNVIGGNLKALAPQPVHLSLPAIMDRASSPENPHLQMDFACESHPFRVVVS